MSYGRFLSCLADLVIDCWSVPLGSWLQGFISNIFALGFSDHVIPCVSGFVFQDRFGDWIAIEMGEILFLLMRYYYGKQNLSSTITRE
jgi:hypothetical protein